MKISAVVRQAACIAVACLCGTAASAQEALSYQVITSSEPTLYTNFTLVIGENDMVLIDAPWNNSEAHRLVADMIETGKNLTHIYITHDHPDHFWAMQVVMDAYPEAEVISHPEVVADIWRSIPFKITRWNPMLGSNGPKYPTAPQAMTEDYFELEGHRIEVIGPMQGDHRNATAVWIPDLSLLVAGDLVFHGIHPWLTETLEPQRMAWIKSLEILMELDPETVVAGHKLPHLDNDVAALEVTRNYIEDFNREAKTAGSSEVLIARIRELYPDIQDVLNDFILTNSAQVGVGEAPPWDE